MKNLNRSEQREVIMTALYQISLYEKTKMPYNIDNVISELVEIDNDFIKNTVHGVLENINEIDSLANKYLTDWDIERLGKTDQAILRLGIYELNFTDTPDIVCINEAIDLSKKFSDDNVRKMINSVLDKIYNARLDKNAE